MRAKKGYVLTATFPVQVYSKVTKMVCVLSPDHKWELLTPRIFSSRPEATRQLKHRVRAYVEHNVRMQVMSYRDWEKLAVESEISR